MLRNYKEENWGNQFTSALHERLRTNGAVIELTVDNSSAWKREAEESPLF
jgi:hypothetical protein